MDDSWWVNEDDLDDDQREVIDLSIDCDQLITGPPGSGKTNLLLLKGSQFFLDDRPNILFLTFTRALKNWIVAGSSNYDFERDKVMTFTGWMMRFLRKEGVRFTLSNNFVQDREMLTRLCTTHAASRKYKGIYNAILVDEGQDCTPDEVGLFAKLADVLYVALDDKQRIYATASAVHAWHDVIPDEQRHELKYHYRNGRRICILADGITPVEDAFKLSPTSKYDEQRYPSVVRVRKLDRLEEQIQDMLSAIGTELRAYPNGVIGVLCVNQAILRRVVEMVRDTPIADLSIFHLDEGDGYSDFDDEKRVIFCTMYSAKGLEFRTLHLLQAEQIGSQPNDRNLAYTSVTRAKTSLNIYHGGSLPAFFSNALRALSPTRPPAGLSRLMRRRSTSVE